tara:strand:+ start:36 stop:260 length:225 start_codon:yes stop_codon:yes gene_type:complete
MGWTFSFSIVFAMRIGLLMISSMSSGQMLTMLSLVHQPQFLLVKFLGLRSWETHQRHHLRIELCQGARRIVLVR